MSQEKWLIDASALLAAIHNEKGGNTVKQHIDNCLISSVNWSEVVQKLAQSGGDVNQIQKALKALGLTIVDFTEEDARLCATLWPACKSLGLSLADRACLATGLRLKSKVVTADRAWSNLKITLKIDFIR